MKEVKKENLLFLILSSVLFVDADREHFSNQTVEIVEFSVPRYPKVGEDVTLSCLFRLGGPKHRLYTVNWWRGRDQFYTYKTSNAEPKTSRLFKGIKVSVERSSEAIVYLLQVNEATSGLFRCEVMGEGPTFKTAVDAKRMTVVVLPSFVEIKQKVRKGSENVYEIDEFVQMNCTSHGTKPSPHLVWKINGVEVKRTEMRRYPDLYVHQGHVTSTLALRFLAARYFINKRAKVTCIVELHGHKFISEVELMLNNPSSALGFSVVWKNPIGFSLLLLWLMLHPTSASFL